MKILLSTGSLYHLPYEKIFSIAANYKFDGIELYLQYKKDLDRIDPDNILSLSDKYQLPIYVLHTPSYERYLFEFLFRRKVTTIKVLTKAQELLHKIKAEVLIIHPWPAILSKRTIRSKMNKLFKATLRNSPETKIALEILPALFHHKFTPHCINKDYEFYRFCEKENYYVVIDISHIYSQKLDPVMVFNNLKEFVVDIHISDYKKRTHHLPLGWGTVDFDTFFKVLNGTGYEYFLTLELNPKRFNDEKIIGECKRLLDKLSQISYYQYYQ